MEICGEKNKTSSRFSKAYDTCDIKNNDDDFDNNDDDDAWYQIYYHAMETRKWGNKRHPRTLLQECVTLRNTKRSRNIGSVEGFCDLLFYIYSNTRPWIKWYDEKTRDIGKFVPKQLGKK